MLFFHKNMPSKNWECPPSTDVLGGSMQCSNRRRSRRWSVVGERKSVESVGVQRLKIKNYLFLSMCNKVHPGIQEF